MTRDPSITSPSRQRREIQNVYGSAPDIKGVSNDSPQSRALHPRFLDRWSCFFRRQESDQPSGCVWILRSFHNGGGEYLVELYLGGNRTDQFNAWNGQDFTYR